MARLDLSNLVVPMYVAGGARTLHKNTGLQCPRKPLTMTAELAASIKASVKRVLRVHDPAALGYDYDDEGVLATIVEFITPSQFVIQDCSETMCVMYKVMHEQLNAYALDAGFVSSRPPVGILVAARFENQFFRAQISCKQNASNHRLICVYFVDYGNEEWVTLMDLRVLPPPLTQLPFWALRVRLAGLVSVNSSQYQWSEMEINAMASLISERNVDTQPSLVKIRGRIGEEEYVPVDLYLPTLYGEDDEPRESLAELLVNASLAVWDKTVAGRASSDTSIVEESLYYLEEENRGLRAELEKMRALLKQER